MRAASDFSFDLLCVPSRPSRFKIWLGARALLLVLSTAAPALAQQAPDAPYVPTPANVIATMLEMAKVGAEDFVIDLGSGDGRIVIEAAKNFGARGMGVELEGHLVSSANSEARRQGLGNRVIFTQGNLFVMDFSRASVLTMYLLPQLNMQLRPRLINELKPGTRVVSHDFDMGAWKPDQTREVSVPNKPYGRPISQVFLWYVPAHAAGTWRWQLNVAGKPRPYEAKIGQLFQELDPVVLVEGGSSTVRNVSLRGAEVSFTVAREMFGQVVNHDFSGRIEGDTIIGRARVSGGGEDTTQDWRATRVARGVLRTD